MKWNDWYLGAGFVVLLWVACMISIIVLGIAARVPLVVVSQVANILSVAFLMLALVLTAVGAGTVVTKDLLRKVRV